MTSPQRAQLDPSLQPLREQLRALVPILESKPGWYGSVYFERKAATTAMVNLKQTQLSDQVTQGVVLRIYDGYTLYEQATDELEGSHLLQFARSFASRVAATPPPPGTQARAYAAPSWKTRLSIPLDEEIRSQIPAQVTAQTPVHFGIRYEIDPRKETQAETLNRLQTLIKRCQDLSTQVGMEAGTLTYAMARQGLAVEESLFMDRESDLSQTLLRISLTLITMSGSDRTFQRVGGLGGLEAIAVDDASLKEQLRDLKALKQAERLSPGKYRVVFGPVVTGVLAHEAFGHSQEGDTCARGRSKAWDLHHSGESVGNEHATILNNPAIYENGASSYAAWGSYFFDEEGWLAHEQVLLDRGRLSAPMTNLTSALRLGVPRTANGKRESWAHGVYTRQTNTYFSAGDKTFEQLLMMLGDGYLALHPAGGMEDPKGMGIQVGISFLEEVRGGKRTGRLVRGPAGGDIQMTGYTPDVLNSIRAKSKIEADSSAPDRARHPINDVGGCGKYHKEFVYAGCGGPYMLLENVILG